MDNSEIFPSWGELDDGKHSFWSADWFVDKDQDKETIILTMTVNNEETFNWFYPEIHNAYYTDTLKEFLARHYKKEVTEENLTEFKDFLFHWFKTVENGGNLDIGIEDDFVQERDEDFENLDDSEDFENRTIH